MSDSEVLQSQRKRKEEGFIVAIVTAGFVNNGVCVCVCVCVCKCTHSVCRCGSWPQLTDSPAQPHILIFVSVFLSSLMTVEVNGRCNTLHVSHVKKLKPGTLLFWEGFSGRHII